MTITVRSSIGGITSQECLTISAIVEEHRVGAIAIIDCSEITSLTGIQKSFYVNRVIVPVSIRGRGVGVALMEQLAKIADEHSFTLYIDPTSNYGSDVVRLTRFFARFGFVTSTDIHRSFGRMVRNPK